MKPALTVSPGSIRLAVAGLLAWVLSASATDISNIPLVLKTTGQARPNVMFILDDSGSMASEYVPDAADYSNRCFGYFGLNAIFYNPAKTYDPPKREDGTSYPAATWPKAYKDGFVAGTSTTVDLSTSGPFSKNSEKFYYTTLKTGLPTPTTCTSGDYDLVAVLPAGQQQNYANWYSYYRTRMLAMRTAVGRTFANGAIDATKIRVGFSTISETGILDSSNKFLNIRDFDANVTIGATTKTQRQWFFDRMYIAKPSGYTPLRPALEKAGKYFANKKMDGTALPTGSDPVQYSCQRNYALLSTDGYWNKTDETNYRSSYAPQGVKGAALNNQDGGSTARPYYDAGLSSGSLADIAYYYYMTDLRDNATNSFGNCTGALGTDVCSNDVVPSGRDTARWQHMTTYTLGVGVVGTLPFRADYETANSGAYYNILNNTGSPKDWPNPNTGSTSSTVTTRVDDLWHAAVNGRGYYYNAGDSASLSDSLTQALTEMGKDPGSAAAASTSTLKPVTGDDKIFVGKYVPSAWYGKLESYTINVNTGAVTNPDSPNWEAGAVLKARNLATSPRSIYFFKSTATKKLDSFSYGNLSATQQSYFNNLCSAPAKLGQCASLNATALAKANSGTNVIAYLAGASTYELAAASADDQVFRTRTTPLGDLVNASPVYVKKPPFKYADGGYAAFASGSTRAGVVYAAANDGMLHAFSASTGAELWAFVPSAVMSQMYRLADKNYSDSENHRFYVDATPVVGDVFDGTNWRTILIGGLGAGGRSYYALDITDPNDPIGLWEFTDTHMGLTYGNPIITKLKSNTWVAVLNSGYDNNTGGGDGNGRLYVLNALTGASEIAAPVQTYTSGTTAAGTVGTPNNLGRINAWIADEVNNTAHRIYGGDMRGNLWRFDLDDNIAPAGNEAFLLAKATTPGGAVQPISVRPQLTEITASGSKVALVSFGTGRYLGATDLTDTSTQSLYVVKDNLSSTALGALRANAAMVKQSMTATHTLINPEAVNYTSNAGWYIDFDRSSKERISVDMQQQLTTLTVATNIPGATACSPGGTGYLYYFDLASAKILQSQLFTTPIVGISTILVGTEGGKQGTPVTEVTGGNGTITPVVDPTLMGTSGLSPRRTSWRELVK